MFVKSLPAYDCLQDVLKAQAVSESADCIFYSANQTEHPTKFSYHDLYTQALQYSQIIRRANGFKAGRPVLLHLDDQRDSILWFWATLLAGGIPVQSTPLSHFIYEREKYLNHLSTLLESPICITRAISLPMFDCVHTLQLHTVESLEVQKQLGDEPTNIDAGCVYGDTAMLLLTSGSTGAPKAVPITHRQALAAVSGKSSVRLLPPGHPFLNWIRLDHVASVIEIHLQALWLGVGQIHVPATELISSPLLFLDILHKHKVAVSFAPNFFLAKLVATVDKLKETPLDRWDLRNLTTLTSGGEANDVETCVSTAAILSRFGAPPKVLVPGFGMTETCAGAIFNLDCPAYDLDRGYQPFVSLGRCMRGIEMRLVPSASDPEGGNSAKIPAVSDRMGELQVRGPVVCQGYFQNPQATREAFTDDGWFRTGDLAIIDEQGCLLLIGRVKDVVNINSVKISNANVQSSLDRALKDYDVDAIAFPSRPTGAPTEQVTVAYLARHEPGIDISEFDESKKVVEIEGRITEAILFSTGSIPVTFELPKQYDLPRNGVGKISRANMRLLFEQGAFDKYVGLHRERVAGIRTSQRALEQLHTTQREALLLADLAEVLGIDATQPGMVEAPFLYLGCTSMDLIRLKRRVSDRLRIDVPIISIIRNPSVRLLAAELDQLAARVGALPKLPEPAYDPVIVLHATGTKSPLWLFHPGVGEVLVFVGLARELANTDKPIYALRARGFEQGHLPFRSVKEAVAIYHAAITRIQPSGPYALAGYSYGSMLAFETAKVLEGEGSEVQFLACLNLPPFIGNRMSQLTWPLCLLHLAHFLGMCAETVADELESSGILHKCSQSEAMDAVINISDRSRMRELGLDNANLAAWADVAYSLQRMAVDYQPGGTVSVMDVFHATPLTAVGAQSYQDWVDNFLGRWREFCPAVSFHGTPGAHYTMIGPDHVTSFAKTFKAVMETRGL